MKLIINDPDETESMTCEVGGLITFTWWKDKYVIVTPRAYYHTVHMGKGSGSPVEVWRYISVRGKTVKTVRRYLPWCTRVQLVRMDRIEGASTIPEYQESAS